MYNCYRVPKKNGKTRLICEPEPFALPMLEYLRQEFDKIELHPAAHGFVSERNTVTNATPHRRQPYILNIDIEDFFRSVKFDTFLQECSHLLSNQLLHWLPICFYKDALATGAPTSPVLSNIFLRRIDCVLVDIALENNLTYTRYADDLTFSGGMIDKSKVVGLVEDVLAKLGLRINFRKVKLMPYYQKQVVTGILVNNQRLSLPRAYKESIFQEVRGRSFSDFSLSLQGTLEYIRYVDPVFYMKLLREIKDE